AEQFLVFVSAKGMAKKVELSQFAKIRRTGIQCMNIKEGDSLVKVKLCLPNNEVLIATRLGYAIRFKQSDLRAIGRSAMGVRGIKLRSEEDQVVDLVIDIPGTNIVTITKRGYGKHSPLDLYRLTKRSGKGVINIKFRDIDDEVIAVKSIPSDKNLLVASQNGIIIRVRTEDIRQTGRAAKGVIVMRLDEGDAVSSVALCEIEECEIEENPKSAENPESVENPESTENPEFTENPESAENLAEPKEIEKNE
ncbi:MAG: DNA gyrase C-terminal beta-propeller domain-containing protein, partial [Promethearchaeota archaeon]